MSKTIFKFPLEITGKQVVPMQRGGKILSIQLQNELPCLWAEVDRSAPIEDRVIEIFGTGHPMWEGERTYINSIQQGQFVWHFYELHHLPTP